MYTTFFAQSVFLYLTVVISVTYFLCAKVFRMNSDTKSILLFITKLQIIDFGPVLFHEKMALIVHIFFNTPCNYLQIHGLHM